MQESPFQGVRFIATAGRLFLDLLSVKARQPCLQMEVRNTGCLRDASGDDPVVE